MPLRPSAGKYSVFSSSYCRATCSCTAGKIASSCCRGVRPEGSFFLSPASAARTRDPTRTMKNSSKLVEQMDRNLPRSSKGLSALAASSSTRRLKLIQLSSRLKISFFPMVICTSFCIGQKVSLLVRVITVTEGVLNSRMGGRPMAALVPRPGLMYWEMP